MGATIHQAITLPGVGIALMARCQDWNAANITQAGVTSIAYAVVEKLLGTAIISGSLVVADTIFDSLQTDSAWDADSTGYNFRWDAPATITPASGKLYQAVVTITPATGAVFKIPFELQTLGLVGS